MCWNSHSFAKKIICKLWYLRIIFKQFTEQVFMAYLFKEDRAHRRAGALWRMCMMSVKFTAEGLTCKSNRNEQKQLHVALCLWWGIPRRLNWLAVRQLCQKPLWIPYHPEELYFLSFHRDVNWRKQRSRRIVWAWSFSIVRNGYPNLVLLRGGFLLSSQLGCFLAVSL